GHVATPHNVRLKPKASCKHLTQLSRADSGINTAILISEVEMSSAFTPCRASDSKSCDATPACERIPTPTTATFATVSSADKRHPVKSDATFRARRCASRKSSRCTVKTKYLS